MVPYSRMERNRWIWAVSFQQLLLWVAVDTGITVYWQFHTLIYNVYHEKMAKFGAKERKEKYRKKGKGTYKVKVRRIIY